MGHRLALLLVPLIAFQDDPPTVREQVADHLRVLRSHRAELERRLEAMDALLELGVVGAEPLLRRVERDLESRRRDRRRLEGRLARGFEERARRVGRERVGREHADDLRVLLGLNALRVDLKLCDACRGHSRDMVEHGFFSHDSPIEGKETPWKRAALEGTTAGAENIAAGAADGPDAIRMWWYSPGHHRNMLGAHARVGLGRWEETWTQCFG